MRLEVRRLGTVGYEEAVTLQTGLVEARRRGEVPDLLLLLQHPPVITLGVKTRHNRANIVATPAQLAEAGVAVVESGRGGDVTYHGPGQLVGYPILDLNPDRRDVHRYVRDIEQGLIDAVGEFGIAAERVPGLTGIWAGRDKLAAIGVRVSRWITSHGFALNVSTDLSGFDLIVPCGIQGRGVTSLERLLGRRVAMDTVEAAVESAFRRIFEKGDGSNFSFSHPPNN